MDGRGKGEEGKASWKHDKRKKDRQEERMSDGKKKNEDEIER
jgi:hypothetical protein